MTPIVLFCSVLFCSVLFCPVLFCSALYCTARTDSFLGGEWEPLILGREGSEDIEVEREAVTEVVLVPATEAEVVEGSACVCACVSPSGWASACADTSCK